MSDDTTTAAIQAIRDRLDGQVTRPPWHDVQVHWPDGRTHLDGIRGVDRQHAIDTAEWNWGPGSLFGRCDRIEYLGIADDQTDPADDYNTPTDWWCDAPGSDDDEAVL